MFKQPADDQPTCDRRAPAEYFRLTLSSSTAIPAAPQFWRLACYGIVRKCSHLLFRKTRWMRKPTPPPVGSFTLYNRLNDFGNLFCQSIYLLTVRALYHDAHKRLRAGRTNQDSAVIAQLPQAASIAALTPGSCCRVAFLSFGTLTLIISCGHGSTSAAISEHFLPLAFEDGRKLQGSQLTVTGGGIFKKNNVSRLLAARYNPS